MIDPSIVLRFRPVQVADPVESYAQGLSLRDMLRRGEAGDLAIEEQRRQIAEDQAFREALGRGAKLSDLMAISPARAVAWQNAEEQRRRLQAQTAAQEDALKRAKVQRLGQIASTIKDEATYRSGIDLAAKEGLITPEEAEAYRNTPWGPEVQARVGQLAAAIKTPQERIAEQRMAAQAHAEANLPKYTLGEVIRDPNTLQFTAREYGAVSALLGRIRPNPITGQNWQTGTMSFTFPNPVDQTVKTVETAPGTIGARPRQPAGSASSGRQKVNPFPAIEAKKQWELQQAERTYLLTKDKDPDALAKLEAAKARAQFNYEQAIRRAGGTVVPQTSPGGSTNTNDPLGLFR